VCAHHTNSLDPSYGKINLFGPTAKAIKCYMYVSLIQQQKGVETKNQLVSIQSCVLHPLLYIYGTNASTCTSKFQQPQNSQLLHSRLLFHMGLLRLSCFHRGSVSRQVHRPDSPVPACRVIAADGSLKELPAPCPLAAVSDVLGLDGDTPVASSFVCNADALYFNEHPPALAPGDVLRPGQMYFVLPADLLGRPLSADDMAALAVRASAALVSSGKPQQRRRCGKTKKAVRIMPVQEAENDVDLFNETLNELTLGQAGSLLMSPAGRKGDEKLAAAIERSRLKRALSIIRE